MLADQRAWALAGRRGMNPWGMKLGGPPVDVGVQPRESVGQTAIGEG
jgi:hypothetical protein